MAAGSWPTYETVQAQHRVMQLAARPAVHRAFHWLHLHERQMRAWQLEFLGIAAPSFAEQARARWFVERFTALGLATAQLDEAGNAVAELRAESTTGASSNTPVVLFSAHLDTVFAAGVPVVPIEDGERILGPGACDNGAGLAALLGRRCSSRASSRRLRFCLRRMSAKRVRAICAGCGICSSRAHIVPGCGLRSRSRAPAPARR
jgi:hypothetical protein